MHHFGAGPQIKGLDSQNGTLQHGRWWLNFSASGDSQRTVGARHDAGDDRVQGEKRRVYSLSLPLSRPVVPERVERRQSEGKTVFVLRKETPNSEWVQLIKEPAKTLYKRHMTVDFKMKYDRDDEDEDTAEDVWASHEYRVERVTQANADEVITATRIVVLLFFPVWVHPQYSVHWAHQFASAAEALEGRATLAVVNAQAESAAPVVQRYGVKLSPHDGNYSRPEFRVFVDGGKVIPEGYTGDIAAEQLLAFVTRLEGVCDQTPCAPVHTLKTDSDIDLLLGRHELTAIATGFNEADGLHGSVANVTRSLQALGVPPYHRRAKGVGVGWCGGANAFSTLQTQLNGMPKIDMRDIDFPALLLLRVPGAPDEGTTGGMAPPIMVVTASVIRPADGKKFKKAELKSAIAGWGFKNEGVKSNWGAADLSLATRSGVISVILVLSSQGAAAVLDEDQPQIDETMHVHDAAGLRDFRAYVNSNQSAPVQTLATGSGHTEHMALLTSYGWVPSTFPALVILRKSKLHAFPAHSKYGELSIESMLAFERDVCASKFKALLRSEQASAEAGPGTGEVDRVVATTASDFVSRRSIDVVLAVYSSGDELGEKRRSSIGKIAQKMSHVTTLAFVSQAFPFCSLCTCMACLTGRGVHIQPKRRSQGALDKRKNDIPATLAKAMGADKSRFEGIWVFSSQVDEAPVAPAYRCKRKASTKELAQCIKNHVGVAFPAKVSSTGALVVPCDELHPKLGSDTGTTPPAGPV